MEHTTAVIDSYGGSTYSTGGYKTTTKNLYILGIKKKKILFKLVLRGILQTSSIFLYWMWILKI